MLRRLIFLVLLLPLSASHSIAQSCLPDGITFLTQDAVDSFSINYPGCTEIGGWVNISQFGSSADISNLDGLANLNSIGGDLYIQYNNNLINLDGLANLNSIGGDLSIQHNNNLTNMDGLANVTSIGGNLYISFNDNLANMDGLASVTFIGGDLSIRYNDNLINMDGLANLTSISGVLYIDSNDNLTNIDGLANVASIGGNLYIGFNDNLANLDGLTNLNSIGSYLSISFNNNLTNMDGLANLNSIGNLYIGDNPNLTNIDGLANVASIGENLNISSNDNLTDCCGIQELLSTPGAIGGGISIYANPSSCSNKSEILAAACGLTMAIQSFSPCINASNGSLQITINRYDTIPFFYSWEREQDNMTGSGSSQDNVFSIDNLSAGTYSVTVTTATPDTVIKTGIVLSELLGSVFEIIEISTTNSSNGVNNGSITLTINGGTAPYSFDWSGVSSGSQNNISGNSFTIPNLTQGEYSITVSDDAGHQQSVAVSLLDETVPVFPCTEPMDIVILNDVSGSVDQTEYSESKQFFVDFLEEANIGNGANESRAAIIEWSDDNEQAVKIPITGNASTLQDYVNFQRAFGGGTSPHDAMEFGRDYLLSNARPNVARVLVLSTDGSGGQISPSLIALADELKAAGFHIITIAFDAAFAENTTRNILTKVASLPQLAPGAPAYSQLDQNLAKNIVNLYLCPIDPGSTATAYFNRDGAIDILDIVPIGNCPYPDGVEITFTIEALRELSLPSGTPVTFYHNNPNLFGANKIMTWIMPCALPAGEIDTFTFVLPVTSPSNIFAVLNDDASSAPPIQFPITAIEELAYSNNIDNQSICTEGKATLQTNKYTSTPIPVCDTMVIYTIDVCNISDIDAFDVTVTDIAPADFVLVNTIFNNNGCSNEDNGSYDIPAGCCISLTLTYDASQAGNSFYHQQDVDIDGPANQVYIDFDGSQTSSEDVLIDGSLDCPSTVVEFSKEVSVTESCDDAYLVYKFTINNEMNIPLQGLEFTDILPAPCTWAFEPYLTEGLSIGNTSILGGTASFVIDEVQPNTVAIFYLDAGLGTWPTDGILTNSASLANVPDPANGGVKILITNEVSTSVTASPMINLPDTLFVSATTTYIDLDAQVSDSDITWTTSGDGYFSDAHQSVTIYYLGQQDSLSQEVHLFISIKNDCHESGQNVVIVKEECGLSIDNITIGDCNDNGTSDDNTDDTYVVSFNVSATNPGTSNTYSVSDGTNNFGPFDYNSVQSITLPADGVEYTLTFADSELDYCSQQQSVNQAPCSNACALSIDNITIGDCDDNGTSDDNTDDTYMVTFNVSATNPGTNNTYSVSDGTNNFSSFDYNSEQSITLPADGVEYTLTFVDSELDYCSQQQTVSQAPCSNACALSIDNITIGDCNDNGTPYASLDDTYPVTYKILAENPGPSNTYQLKVGSQLFESLKYNANHQVDLAANGLEYKMVFSDSDKTNCIVEQRISQAPCSDKTKSDIFIPNVFSPNDDNINDYWKIYRSDSQIKILSCRIYDRWGDKVFEVLNDNRFTWNGRYKGQIVPNGVYVYAIEYLTPDSANVKLAAGDLTVVR